MPFSFADDVGSISANRLIKKYKKLRALGNSYIHHTTDSQGKTFNFVMFTANFQNEFALCLYNKFLEKYPVVNDANRKGVDKELDNLIRIAEENLPKREQETAKA